MKTHDVVKKSGKRPAPTRQHWALVRRIGRRLRRRRERRQWTREAAQEALT